MAYLFYLMKPVSLFFSKSSVVVKLLLMRLEDSKAAIGTLEAVLFSSALLEESVEEEGEVEVVLFSSALLEESVEEEGEVEVVLFSSALFISSTVCSKFLLKELNTPSLF
jgi:hypothetical protein